MLHRAALVVAGLALLGAGPPAGVEAAADVVTVTTYGPGGPVTREVPGAEVDARLHREGEPRLHPRCVPGLWCGPDIAIVEPRGPFCDTASAWVAHSGSPGQAYTQLVPGDGPPEVVCGGFFGPGYDWDLVELSPLAVVVDGLDYEGCYAQDWALHSGGYCPNPFTAADTFLVHWRFRGVGVAAALAGFDYFLAVRGVVCYDMPPGIPGVDAFPCP